MSAFKAIEIAADDICAAISESCADLSRASRLEVYALLKVELDARERADLDDDDD